MDASKLARMANQIAANFDYGPDQSIAVASVADHLRRFWGPLMLDEIAAYMATGDAELSAIAEQALTRVIEERRVAS